MFCYLLLDFHVKTGTRFSLRDKQLFKIRKFEITRIYCIMLSKHFNGKEIMYKIIHLYKAFIFMTLMMMMIQCFKFL